MHITYVPFSCEPSNKTDVLSETSRIAVLGLLFAPLSF